MNKIKNILRTLIIGATLVGGIFGGYKGCSYIRREVKEAYKRQSVHPHFSYNYNFEGFIDGEYVIFHKHLRPQSELWVKKPDGYIAIYETENRMDNLKVNKLMIFNKNGLEKIIHLGNEEGRLEIVTKRQLEFDEYLAKIYKIKYQRK